MTASIVARRRAHRESRDIARTCVPRAGRVRRLCVQTRNIEIVFVALALVLLSLLMTRSEPAYRADRLQKVGDEVSTPLALFQIQHRSCSFFFEIVCFSEFRASPNFREQKTISDDKVLLQASFLLPNVVCNCYHQLLFLLFRAHSHFLVSWSSTWLHQLLVCWNSMRH